MIDILLTSQALTNKKRNNHFSKSLRNRDPWTHISLNNSLSCKMTHEKEKPLEFPIFVIKAVPIRIEVDLVKEVR